MPGFAFSEDLYKLNVQAVDYGDFPKIIDPNVDLEKLSPYGTVRCYNPNLEQTIQLAFIIWQVATRDRNSRKPGTDPFDVAELRCTKTRENLTSLLLPFVDGDENKAKDLCVNLLQSQRLNLEKYIKGWKIVPKPDSVWVDRNSKTLFIVEYMERGKKRIAVGLNPTSDIFIYEG